MFDVIFQIWQLTYFTIFLCKAGKFPKKTRFFAFFMGNAITQTLRNTYMGTEKTTHKYILLLSFSQLLLIYSTYAKFAIELIHLNLILTKVCPLKFYKEIYLLYYICFVYKL